MSLKVSKNKAMLVVKDREQTLTVEVLLSQKNGLEIGQVVMVLN